MNILDDLNDIQRAAVEASEGPVMILAGAGSGKTRVLTYKIAHLINSGVDSFRIMALTFTNKAAKEMKTRITKLIGSSESLNVWMGTFHSVFAKILRFEAEKIGYPSNFTIYDTDDSLSLIKTILKEMNLDDKVYKPSLVYNRISNAKNNLVSAEEYLKNATIQSDDIQSKKPLIGQIYLTYQKRCFKSGAMDFDDLLYQTNILLRDFPDVLYKYQDKFQFLLVDEFQDTNFSQYNIIKKISARYENICVVGDDAQSIYAFRGANIQNILNFKKDFPETKVFKLEQNYRSTQNIVNAANSVILHNKNQFKKDVWTENTLGEKISVYKANTDNEEGQIVANEIFDSKIQNQLFNKDFAILYRTNSQSRAIEEALRKKNIPYKIYGGLSFYKRKEIKDLLSYFRLTINPNDEEALKRVINYPIRGIGKTSIEKALVCAANSDKSLWEIISEPHLYALDANSGTIQKMKDFVTMIQSFATLLKTQDAFELASHIAKSSGLLKDLYDDKTPEGLSRYDNILELLNGVKEFVETNTKKENATPEDTSLPLYMEEISLLTDNIEKKEDEELDTVSLMTIHAAKGLEYPYVFVVGLEENLFPSQLSINSREELEEERRLFYVAVTRSEKKLILTYSTTRYRWGNLIYNEPSRFIEEINPDLIEYKNIALQKTSANDQQKSISSAAPLLKKKNLVKVSPTRNPLFDSVVMEDVMVGVWVEHEKFGKGKVVHMEGDADNKKATVFFQTNGQKQLLLKYAKLRILEEEV